MAVGRAGLPIDELPRYPSVPGMDPTYPLVPIANFVGCLLTLISLVDLLTRPWNTGVFMFAVYNLLQSLVVGINTIVWSNNADDIAPVWCDIASHLRVFTSASIPTCLFIITHRLFNIVSFKSSLTYMSHRERRTQLLLESLLCLGFPLIVTGIFYTVQSARYSIYEEVGCGIATYHSGASVLLESIGIVALPFLSLSLHAPKILWTLYRRRKELAEFLDSTEKTHRNDFVRPFILSVVVILPVIINIFIYIALTVGATEGPGPLFVFWPGWSTIHSDWKPKLISTSLWAAEDPTILSLKYGEWVNPVYALGFFAIYGLTEGVRQRYQSIFWVAVKLFGVPRNASESKIASAIVFNSTPVSISDVSSSEEVSAYA